MDKLHGISRLLFILLPEFPVYFHVVLKISRLSSINFHTKNTKFTSNFQIRPQLGNLHLVWKLWKLLVSILFTVYFLISILWKIFNFSSDYAILCSVAFSRPKPGKAHFTFRKFRDIEMDSWKKDILNSVLYRSTPDLADVNSLLDQYNVLSDLIDKHTPECSRSITLRPNAPWFNDSLRAMKSQRRKLERKYLSTRLEVHRQMYRDQCQIYTATLHSAKSTYYKAKISESDNYQLFRMVDGLFKVKRLPPLPSHVSSRSLAEDFGEFFHSNIEKIRDCLHNSNAQSTETSVLINPSPCPTSLSEFMEVSETYIRELIDKSKPKSCCLDPVPTRILKQSVDVLAQPITKVVNASLMTSEFPSSLKKCTIYPSIKKQILDQEEFTSYRPITNVAFLSKTLERVVAAQTINYLTDNDLMSKLQSAYGRFHSTETALLRVCDDILLALDSRQEVVLVLLDLSAFDTINHDVLLHRLRSRYGINGTALNWFRSYLTNRTQSVRIGDSSSSSRTLKYGVPQGSVLGPLLFSLFFAPIEEVILDHGLRCMVYADDTQLT